VVAPDPTAVPGDGLDPVARQLVEFQARVFPKLHSMGDGVTARRLTMAAAAALTHDHEPLPVHRTVDASVPGPDGPIAVRLYWPSDEPDLPVVVFAHGGGWVLCDLDSHDGMCRGIVRDTGCVVVAVHYRRAPEHRFPAAPEDVYAVTQWVASNPPELGIDPQRIALFGDSAGGNVAAATALMCRDRGGPALVAQVLVYPVTDAACDSASHREIGHDYGLWTEEVQWTWTQYLASPDDAAHPYASPLRAPDLSGLPPTLVITPEFDPLRDEGEAYGQRLREAGVPSTVTRYPGMFHSFLTYLTVLDAAAAANAQVAAMLRDAFGTTEPTATAR
jgi:acetyl esterase